MRQEVYAEKKDETTLFRFARFFLKSIIDVRAPPGALEPFEDNVDS